MRKIFLAILGLLFAQSVALAASLLPNGKQQFLDTNGAPLSGGAVYFYVPGTTTPKDTWQDASATILNTNPVMLDSGGFAVIFGSGAYREVVKDGSGNVIYDQLTYDTSSSQNSWAGTAGGSANSVIVSAGAFSGGNGQTVSWRAAATNTGPATVTIGGNTYVIVKDEPTGVIPLIGGEMIAGGIVNVTFDSTSGQMHLLVPVGVSPVVSIAASATTDLGGGASPNVNITGTGSITSFGSTASTNAPIYFLTFAGSVTLTHNPTSLILPSGGNITTIAGATVVAQYLGAGNWKVLEYSLPGGIAGEFINSQTGTSYTIVPADFGKLVSFSNAAAIAVTVPQAQGSGVWFDVQNVGAGLVTLTPTTSTINGAASFIIPKGYSARVISDGTNWQVSGFNPLQGRVLLNTISGSGGTLQDTTSFTSSFANYELEFENLLGTVAGPSTVQMFLQVQSGGVFQTTSYQSTLWNSNSGGAAQVTATAGVLLSTGTTNSGAGVSGRVQILGANKPFVKGIFGQSVDQPLVNPMATNLIGGFWTGGSGAITGVRVLPGSGNISGTLRIYGYN